MLALTTRMKAKQVELKEANIQSQEAISRNSQIRIAELEKRLEELIGALIDLS